MRRLSVPPVLAQLRAQSHALPGAQPHARQVRHAAWQGHGPGVASAPRVPRALLGPSPRHRWARLGVWARSALWHLLGAAVLLALMGTSEAAWAAPPKVEIPAARPKVASPAAPSATPQAAGAPTGAPMASACADELRQTLPPLLAEGDASAPRLSLLALIERAGQRSAAVGAARLLAQAAQADREETAASGGPQAQLVAQAGPAGTKFKGEPMHTQGLLRPGINVSGTLWDFGKQDQLQRWREQLAEAARLGQISASEQVALQTVSLAFERNRRRLHVQVWDQYAQKVCGLVDALEQITATDKGRASELAQARKQLQQVRLSAVQARSELALTDTRLRRYVGAPLPELHPLSALLLQAPPLPELQRAAAQAPDIARLDAEAQAAERLADATRAGQRPQLGWLLNANHDLRNDRATQWQAGVQLTVPLWAPGADPALQAARQRAEAARLQREDALNALHSRLNELDQQASAALQRAQDVAQVLRASERVRDDTQLMWRQLGRRSLFDVISAEADHFNLRLAYVDALNDGQQTVALMWSLSGGVSQPLR